MLKRLVAYGALIAGVFVVAWIQAISQDHISVRDEELWHHHVVVDDTPAAVTNDIHLSTVTYVSTYHCPEGWSLVVKLNNAPACARELVTPTTDSGR